MFGKKEKSVEKKIISGQTYGQERALYSLRDTVVRSCTFDGAEDGESALKEARGVDVLDCLFALRYPLWHTEDFTLASSEMKETCRAPLWYSKNGVISNCKIDGVKCLRECDAITVRQCGIVSPEFGWRCRDVKIYDSDVDSQYFMFESRNVTMDHTHMVGKYSFQYIENMTIENSDLDTKDAFWHTKNVTVRNSVIKGEYLGWYSDGLTLIGCKIIGTQPLCYCNNLTLINCEMEDTDLSFEYSDVRAEIIGNIMSVKNPASGSIVADSIGEIILENSVRELNCKITTR